MHQIKPLRKCPDEKVRSRHPSTILKFCNIYGTDRRLFRKKITVSVLNLTVGNIVSVFDGNQLTLNQVNC